MAAAHKQFVHGLVDRSHERVVQARAGQCLQQILRDDESTATGDLEVLPRLPPHLAARAVVPALAHNARANERRGRKADSSSESLPRARKQGALAASTSLGTLGPARDSDSGLQPLHHSSSHEQFREYVHQKSYRTETLRQRDRRRGVLPQAKDLHKLAAAVTAQQQSSHEAAKTKLVRALAKIRGHSAFLQARGLPRPLSPSFGDIKNAHLAFLEFRQHNTGTTSSQHRRVHPSVGLEDGNSNSKTPIHFGDQICLLSVVSNLPLAVGADGRSRAAESTSMGPHMTFTIVDFFNPSRRDELTLHDAFWLRVDPSVLRNAGHIGHLSDGDSLESMLVDTSYFLGCPGWLDAECSALAVRSKPRQRERTVEEQSKRFRLVAMKALRPARDYYGDDAATREFAVETNEHVVRLARWRFAVQRKQRRQGKASSLEAPPEDVNDALLNCSLVQLSQEHNLELSYDGKHQRGVCRPMSRRDRPSARSAPTDSVWQVRLLHRPPRSPGTLPRIGGGCGGLEIDGEDIDPAVEWLREKQAVVARNEEKIVGKAGLAQAARQQFERVAARSNGKLAEIEQLKAQRGPAYFEELLHAISASSPGASPRKKTLRASRQHPTRLPVLNAC